MSGASGKDNQVLDLLPQGAQQLTGQKGPESMMTVNVITTTVASKQLNIVDFTLPRKVLLERMVNNWTKADLLDLVWNRLECRE